MAVQNNSFNPVKLMILVYALLTAFFLIAKNILIDAGIEQGVVIIGNTILFLIGMLTVSRAMKAINDPNPHVFVRVFYSGFIIRLFACGIAAFVYIYMSNGKVSKASLFVCLGIYVLYSVIEVSSLQKLLRQKKNA